MLHVSPTMIGRLDELEADLIARRGGPTVRAGSARSKVSTSPSAIFAASETRRAEWPGPQASANPMCPVDDRILDHRDERHRAASLSADAAASAG